MKQILLSLIFLLACLPSKVPAQWLYPQDAVFGSLSGMVIVKDVNGTIRKVQRGDPVYPGEMVRVDEDSYATLRLFDGSILDLKSNTQFMVSSLKHPSDQQKEIRFSLMSGWMMATVQRLMSSTSTFEIEAGGVVCGVRGTIFTVVYDASKEKVQLSVQEGTVYAKASGETHILKGGEKMDFVRAHPSVRLKDDMKKAARELREKTREAEVEAGLKVKEDLSASLMDLNSQFLADLSVNGSALGLGFSIDGMVPTALTLTTAGQGLWERVGGLPADLPLKLPIVH